MPTPLVTSYVNQIARLEVANLRLLGSVMKEARAELIKQIDRNPQQWLGGEYLASIDDLSKQIEIEMLAKGVYATPYQLGLDFSKEDIAAKAGIPKVSDFHVLNPQFRLSTLSFLESEFTNLIRNVSDTFKTSALREIQKSLLLGEGLESTMERIKGKGLKGLNGRDGIFRPAMYRAEMIARTATNDIENRGAYDGYRYYSEQLPELNIGKQWATVSDNRTSDRCISLSGQKAALEELFRANDGWTGLHPPSHVNCRSRVVSTTARWTRALEQKATLEANNFSPTQTPEVSQTLKREQERLKALKISLAAETNRYKS